MIVDPAYTHVRTCTRGSPDGCAAVRSTGESGGGARVSGSALERGALFLWIEGASQHMVYSIWQHRYLSNNNREPTVPNPFRYDHHTNHVVLRTLSPQPVSVAEVSTMPSVHASPPEASPTTPLPKAYASQVFSMHVGAPVVAPPLAPQARSEAVPEYPVAH